MANARKTRKLYDAAVLALNAKNTVQARNLVLKLIRTEKKNFSCWHLKAVIHAELHEIDLAERAFVTAASLAPSSRERATVYEQLGLLLIRNGSSVQAAKYFANLQKLRPSGDDVTYYLAEAHRLNKEHQSALTEYEKAIKQSGNKSELLTGKALCLRELGRTQDAIGCLKQILTVKPNDAETIIALAQCYSDLSRYSDAEDLLRDALVSEPSNAYLHYKLALLYRDFGEIDKAVSYFEKTLSLEPAAATAYYNYARVKHFDADDPIIHQIRQRLTELTQSEETTGQLKDRTELLFALGKIAEDCAQYDQAFDYWRQANTLMRRTFDYEINNDRRRVAAIKSVVDADLTRKTELRSADHPTPIFIIGLPRSGSTLCEQILASHTDIQGMGELTLLPELLGKLEISLKTPYPRILTKLDGQQLRKLRDTYITTLQDTLKRPYFTDKLPSNFWLVGLIKVLFPDSPVINTNRSPIDTGFSCYKHLFSGGQKFAYDLTEIRQYIDLHNELMAYWHEILPGAVYELKYEDLVQKPEETVTSMLAFCELPWQHGCLNFYETRRAVRSSSAAQIRRPLHSDAIGYWRHYENHLHELTGLEQGDLAVN